MLVTEEDDGLIRFAQTDYKTQSVRMHSDLFQKVTASISEINGIH